MSDPLSRSRLGPLPNAGYATKRERAVSDLIMQFIRTIERDRVCLLDIVSSGRAKWRQVCSKALRGARMETELIDAIYDYLALLAGPEPMTQLGNLLHMKAHPPWLGDNAVKPTPQEEERRVREALAFSAAINRKDRSTDELVRKI